MIEVCETESSPRKHALKRTIKDMTKVENVSQQKTALIKDKVEAMEIEMNDASSQSHSRELQHQHEQFQHDKQQLLNALIIAHHEGEENRLIIELANKDHKIYSIKSQLAEMTNSRKILQQRIAGMKSGIKRKENMKLPVVLPTSEKVTVNQPTKNVTTESNDIIYTDVIKVTDNSSKNMFQGTQYFGMHSKHK